MLSFPNLHIYKCRILEILKENYFMILYIAPVTSLPPYNVCFVAFFLKK